MDPAARRRYSWGMEQTDCDIFISGGGPAGLTAACVFGAAGFRVVVADPAPPVTQQTAPGADLRSTAILQPGRKLMEQAGIWGLLSPHAMPLDKMRIVDISGDAPLQRDFIASDISDLAFGWNISNTNLRRVLLDRIRALEPVDFRPGVGFARILARESNARVTLSDGAQVNARLVIACDGRNSAVRDACGIGVKRQRFGQKAIVFAATHPKPHENVSTEVHRSGGPFTLVPLPDYNGAPCSAIVWMEDGPNIASLAALSDTDFADRASERSGYHFGPLTPVTKRQVWPIISQIADQFTAPRVALAAEAAHVVPPIGAQGLNMSLADIAELLRLATQSPAGLGSDSMLDQYARARQRDAHLRVFGVGMLNRASQTGLPAIQGLRATGIRALHDIRPVRQVLMRLGLGV